MEHTPPARFIINSYLTKHDWIKILARQTKQRTWIIYQSCCFSKQINAQQTTGLEKLSQTPLYLLTGEIRIYFWTMFAKMKNFEVWLIEWSLICTAYCKQFYDRDILNIFSRNNGRLWVNHHYKAKIHLYLLQEYMYHRHNIKINKKFIQWISWLLRYILYNKKKSQAIQIIIKKKYRKFSVIHHLGKYRVS